MFLGSRQVDICSGFVGGGCDGQDVSTFDEDFKQGAVRVAVETGKPIAQVARDLGVNQGTLGNWVAKHRAAMEGGEHSRTRPNRRGANVFALNSGSGSANATLQQRLVAVRRFYDCLVEEGVRESNPVGRGRYTPGRGFGAVYDASAARNISSRGTPIIAPTMPTGSRRCEPQGSKVFQRPTRRCTTWGPWSCPPYSENCTPHVMYSDHVVAATVDFGTTVTTGGFECEPAYPQVERVEVSFFTGPKGSETLLETITRDVDGHGGARLFAARSNTGFRSAVITNDSDDQFAIAQIHV